MSVYGENPFENCGNCRYHRKDGDEWICTNENSDCYGCETDYNDECEEFEERG